MQAALTLPDSLSANLGETVRITWSGGSYDYGWHQQKSPGSAPVTVIYNNNKRPSDIPSRFSGALSGSTATLTITGVRAEDEAVYFCGAWESSSNPGMVIGGDVGREKKKKRKKTYIGGKNGGFLPICLTAKLGCAAEAGSWPLCKALFVNGLPLVQCSAGRDTRYVQTCLLLLLADLSSCFEEAWMSARPHLPGWCSSSHPCQVRAVRVRQTLSPIFSPLPLQVPWCRQR